MGSAVRELAGYVVDMKTKLIQNGTLPVSERLYRGSQMPKDLSCMDEDGRYQNVEYFQPVLYDLEDRLPPYNPKWEEYEGNGRTKRLIRIRFPQRYIRWWHKHKERCLNGYTVGGVTLTGPMYFYLNFWRIRSKKRSKKGKSRYFPPRFFDYQKQFFDYVKLARELDKNILVLKRRQNGFSEMMACLTAYEYTFFPGSQSLIIAGEQEYANLPARKLIAGLDAMIKQQSAREFYKRRKVNRDRLEEFEAGWFENGQKVGYGSEVFTITCKDNPQAASGKTPDFVFLEEAGINPLLIRLYNMIIPAMQEQGSQDGRIVTIVATGGEMRKGVSQVMKMFYNPDKYNLLAVENIWEPNLSGNKGAKCALFFPAWQFLVMDHDGNSYKEPSMILIDEGRAKLKGDKKNLHDKLTQFPKTPSEAFTVSGLCPFNTEKLVARKNELLAAAADEHEMRGRLDWIVEHGAITGVEWKPQPSDGPMYDSDGDDMYPIVMFQHPDRPNERKDFKFYFRDGSYQNLYYGGIDSYDRDQAAESDSVGSMSIFKGYLDTNHTSMHKCARLNWRPSKKEKLFEMTARLSCYFGEAQTLIEWSNLTIFDWYKNNQWEHLLKERPEVTYSQIKDSKVQNRYGVDPNTKWVWIQHFASYIEDYSAQMTDLHAIDCYLDFRSKDHNCDVTISDMLAHECFRDTTNQGVFAHSTTDEDDENHSEYAMGYITVNGQTFRYHGS